MKWQIRFALKMFVGRWTRLDELDVMSPGAWTGQNDLCQLLVWTTIHCKVYRNDSRKWQWRCMRYCGHSYFMSIHVKCEWWWVTENVVFSNYCVDIADYLSPNNSNENRNSIWLFIRTTVSSIQLLSVHGFSKYSAWHRFSIINLQLFAAAAAASTPSTRNHFHLFAQFQSYPFRLFKCCSLNGRN